ncbi:MAG: hypothetical protein ACRELY_07085 [Polyangiaceae bacterium]
MKLGLISAFAFVVFSPAVANATPNFPPGMQEDLDLKSAPDCALCHTDGDQGGLGTVNTPFGKSIRAQGVVAFDTGSLQEALTQMQTDDTNSAGACLDDIDELKSGGDPNEAATPGSCTDGGATTTESESDAAPDSPSSSSGCAIARVPGNSFFYPGFMIGAALLVARRRRRR